MNTWAMQRGERGATLVELAVCAPVLLLLGLGTVQSALLLHAKTILNYAVFEAARKGAVTHAQRQPMRDELGLRLAPLSGGSGDAAASARALAKARLDVRDPRFTQLDIISPSQQAFADWAIYNPQSREREIPNSHLRQRHAERIAKPFSGVNLQAANLLTIEVTYGYEMTVPLVGRLAAQALLRLDPVNAMFYLSGRLPIKSTATVRMQSPARPDNNVSVVETGGVSGTDSLESVPVFTPLPVAVCDEHGLPADMDSASLGALLQAEVSDHLCDGDAVIHDLLNSSLDDGGRPPLAGTAESQSSTDCVPAS